MARYSEKHISRSVLLTAKDLKKSYGKRQALRGLSFSLQAGRILGFLGPNGAGKTTSIRILTTMLEPDSGYFTVAGIRSNNPEKIRNKIGVLPENLGFPNNTTGIEYLKFFGQMYGLTETKAKKKSLELLHEVSLLERANSLISTYSHGMRQRLGIARALVNDPVVLFLDEPTLGLDPRGTQELLMLIRRIAQNRHAGIVLCSHDLPEVERVCDQVVILRSGEVIAQGTVADVIGGAQKKGFRQNITSIQVPSNYIHQAQKVITSVNHVESVTQEGEDAGWLRVEFEQSKNATAKNVHHTNNLLSALIRTEIPILSVEAKGGRLEDVFLHLTEEKIT